MTADAFFLTKIHYRTVKAGPATVFYREAGDPRHPTVLLLHGFPTSSHMFRDLIPLLADRYHVVAPDLPGFGFTVAPERPDVHLQLRQSDEGDQRLSSMPSASSASPSMSSTMAPRWDFASPWHIPTGSPRSSRRTATPTRKA